MLQEMLVAEPKDTFLRYGLALEFAREGQPQEAVARLRTLIADEPNYVPAYFQAAQMLLKQGESSAGAELLRSGIAAAQAQGNSHAAEEMSALLEQIE
jgi:predicted Zn-dependent protease